MYQNIQQTYTTYEVKNRKKSKREVWGALRIQTGGGGGPGRQPTWPGACRYWRCSLRKAGKRATGVHCTAYPARLTHLGHTVMLYDPADTYRGKQFSRLKDTQCRLEPRWVSSQAEKFLNTIRNSSNPLRFYMNAKPEKEADSVNLGWKYTDS